MTAWVVPHEDKFFVVCKNRYYRICYITQDKAEYVAQTFRQLWTRKLASQEIDLERDFRRDKRDVQSDQQLSGTSYL